MLKYKIILFLSLFSTILSANDIFKDAPCWVKDSSCTKYKFVGIGISNITYSKNSQLATIQAKNNAKNNLSSYISSIVNSKVKSFLLSKNINNKETIKEIFYSAVNIFSNNKIVGFNQKDNWIDNNDKLYILMSVDKDFETIIQEEMDNSYKNSLRHKENKDNFFVKNERDDYYSQLFLSTQEYIYHYQEKINFQIDDILNN